MSVLEHHEAVLLASEALDAPLDPARERELAVHLVGCADCRSAWEVMQLLRSQLRSTARGLPAALVDSAVTRAVTVASGRADPGPRRPVATAEFAVVPPVPAQAVRSEPAGTPEQISRRPAAAAQPPQAEPAAETAGEPRTVLPVGEPAAEATGERPPANPASDAVAERRVIRADPLLPTDSLSPVQVPRRERRAIHREERGRPPGRRGLVLVPLALIVAGIAAYLVLGPGLPQRRAKISSVMPASELRRRVQAAFDDLRALKTGFRSTSLALYRKGDRQLVFARAARSGTVVYEAPNSLMSDSELTVPGATSSKLTIVRRAGEVRKVFADAGATTAQAWTNAAPGPPDIETTGVLGHLEASLAAPAAMMLTAKDLRVVERTTYRGRPALHVGWTMTADAYTRADRGDALIDARTFLPVRITRTISRANASVLGPGDLLTVPAIDAAFGSTERTISESLELESPSVNPTLTSEDFAVRNDTGNQPQIQNASWEPVAPADLAARLPFTPLLASALPAGFEERATAVSTKPTTWGPRGFPSYDGAAQTLVTDGLRTITISQRRIPRGRDRMTTSPLVQFSAIPVEAVPVGSALDGFRYAASSDVPGHVFGFFGDVYVVVAGYADEDTLVRIARSLRPPSPTPAVSVTPSPPVSGANGATPIAPPLITATPSLRPRATAR